MATIFEDKRVEKNDTENRMRFPSNANIGDLPFACSNDGQSGKLPVIDEKGSQWTFTCRNQNGMIYFTDGWEEFRKGKRIRVGHRITLYKDDDSFGSGALYKIIVMEN
ncbi:hypothetical protein SLE2022_243780 [Rubroshorea leprosula]